MVRDKGMYESQIAQELLGIFSGDMVARHEWNSKRYFAKF